jgi:hypothetical protein
MGRVIAEISMSADGIVAGPDTSTDHRLGKDGDLLHGWMFEGTDELRLHVVPLLFGAGVRLFDAETGEHVQLERTAVHETPNATHLTFRVWN